MRRLLQILADPRHHAWIVLALGVLVLLPRLGSYGFWEPREIAVADTASKWLEREDEPPGKAAPAEEEQEVETPAPEPVPEPTPSSESAGAGGSAEPGVSAEPGSPEEPPAPLAPAKKKVGEGGRPARQKPVSRAPEEPRFTERLVAQGVARLGYTELGARWPLALLGLIAVMAAYFLGARLASPRAGLIGALVMLSFPLLVLQSRQLTSEIAPVTGSALLFLGMAGVALPDRWRRLFTARGSDLVPAALLACDVVAIAAGALLATWSGGVLVGLLPPLVGFGAGALVWSLLGSPREDAADRAPLAVGALALAAACAALAYFLHDTFSWVEAGDGDRHLFGWTLAAARERLPALGMPWKSNGDVQTPFSVLFEQIGFGMFPWIALAPIALGRLALGREERTDGGAAAAGGAGAPWAGAVLFAWAAAAWIAGAVVTRKVTPVLYPALAAIAVGLGVWIDDLLARRERAAEDDDSSSLPVVALFVFCGALVLGKDLAVQPEKFTSLTTAGTVVKVPDGTHLQYGLLFFGALVGVSAAAGLFFWRGPYRLRVSRAVPDVFASIGRWGLHAAVALSVVFALFVSQVWVPGLAARMSSRDVLGAYRKLRREGDELGILGNLGSGPDYYSGGDHVKLAGRKELFEFLQHPGRVFALVRSSERCPIHKEAAKRGFEYHLIDDQNAQFLLLSNQLRPGERDHNPLTRMVTTEAPADLGKKVSVMFEDQIELIGVKMPSRTDGGDAFEMTLFYKVHKPVARSWKVFVHIDGPGGHISGDHQPLDNVCGLTTFQPGDYLIDRFTVDPDASSGSYNKAAGTYKVWTGLFSGSAGNFTNMKVTSGNPDKDGRAPLGEIHLE